MTDISAHDYSEDRKYVSSLAHIDWRDMSAAFASAILPPLCFIGLNGLAISAGFDPSLPVPTYLADAIGIVVFLVLFPATGLAYWAAARQGARGESAARWAFALLLALLAYPFLMSALGISGQSLATVLLFLTGLGAASRLYEVSRLGGLLLLPVLIWSGAGAFLGIAAISGGWTPPFGPVSQH